MKLAIPTQDKNSFQSIIYGHFGSAPYYAVYNDDTGELSFIENDEKNHIHGQCQPTVELTKNNIEAIVCNGLGGRAINNLNNLGIKIYFGENAETVNELIRKYKTHGLQEFNQENACQNHDGCQ